MENNLHGVVDSALGLEASGVVDFKKLRELLHAVVDKLDKHPKGGEDNKDHEIRARPEAKIETSSDLQVYSTTLQVPNESLHDSASRKEVCLLKTHCDISRTFDERVSTLEKSISATATSINELVREFHVIQPRANRELKEIEQIKEHLNELSERVLMNDENRIVNAETLDVKSITEKGNLIFLLLHDFLLSDSGSF